MSLHTRYSFYLDVIENGTLRVSRSTSKMEPSWTCVDSHSNITIPPSPLAPPIPVHIKAEDVTTAKLIYLESDQPVYLQLEPPTFSRINSNVTGVQFITEASYVGGVWQPVSSITGTYGLTYTASGSTLAWGSGATPIPTTNVDENNLLVLPDANLPAGQVIVKVVASQLPGTNQLEPVTLSVTTPIKVAGCFMMTTWTDDIFITNPNAVAVNVKVTVVGV